MSEPDAIVELEAEPARLAAAVLAVAMGDEGRNARLRSGAEQSAADEPTDPDTARRFQTVLELGYLVASADGFDQRERTSLAALLENITGKALDQATLELHFRDLEEAVATFGRRERLARVTADLDDEAARVEAVELATLIAMADGKLANKELEVLVEAGRHLKFAPTRILSIVEQQGARVRAKLR